MEVPFEQAPTSDLVPGNVYLGGNRGSYGDDPIAKLLGCGNQGGIRFSGSLQDGGVHLAVLYSTFEDSDWPDRYEADSNRLVYFGDNKTPDRDLHATPRHGNALFRMVFADLHARPTRRDRIPPFFCFARAAPGRSVTFLGLGVPGAPGVDEMNDLVAVWKTKDGQRFQNYRAIFTLLPVARVPRSWIDARQAGTRETDSAPDAWRRWLATGATGESGH